jgi:hypothetical protein
MTKTSSCRNFNHGKSNAPVRVCPMCGEVVNVKRAIPRCSLDRHAQSRKSGDKFCVDCGGQLRAG